MVYHQVILLLVVGMYFFLLFALQFKINFFFNRTSPGIMSPPQQQIQQQQQQIQQQQQQLLNGPSLILKNPIPLTSTSPSADSMSSLKTMAQEAINRAGLENTTDVIAIPSETTVRQQLFMDAAVTNGPNLTNLNNVLIMKSTGTSEAHIPPLLGVAPLGPSPLQKEHQLQVCHFFVVFFVLLIFVFLN